MSTSVSYNAKRGVFIIRLDDRKITMEMKVAVKGSRRLGSRRIEALKEFLIGMIHETLTGVSLVRENKKDIFKEYCKARSYTLRYIDTLDRLKEYGKVRPPPDNIIV